MTSLLVLNTAAVISYKTKYNGKRFYSNILRNVRDYIKKTTKLLKDIQGERCSSMERPNFCKLVSMSYFIDITHCQLKSQFSLQNKVWKNK